MKSSDKKRLLKWNTRFGLPPWFCQPSSATPEHGPSLFVIVAGTIGLGALYCLQTSSALKWFDLPSSRMCRLLIWAASGLIAVGAEFWFGIQFSRHA